MFVFDGKHSYMRGMVSAIASRNGSFISFRFEWEGLTKFVLIPIDDLQRCFDELREDGKIKVSINLDQAIDIETMADEFEQRRKWLAAFMAAQNA